MSNKAVDPNKLADDFFADKSKKRVIRRFESSVIVEQNFRKKKKQYKLVDNKLVVIGEIDIQEQINSNRDCALDVILDKFLHTGIIEGSYSSGLSLDDFDVNADPDEADYHDELYNAAIAVDQINQLRKKYGLPDSYNEKQVVAHVINLHNNVSKDIERKVKGLESEKKDVKSSQVSEKLSQDSKQDSYKESNA